MSDGNDVASEKGGKMAVISKKIDYLHESCVKNLKLSCEIRAKLLSPEAKDPEEAEKTPRSSGQLNNIIDHLQDLLNFINSSNANLVAVNKET